MIDPRAFVLRGWPLRRLPAGLRGLSRLMLLSVRRLRVPAVRRVEVASSGVTEAPEAVKLTWTHVQVPHVVVVAPHELTAEQVFGHGNAEVRRVMLERADPAVLLQGDGVKVIHEDQDAGGRRRLLRLNLDWRNHMQFLECRCPSTGRVYHLRIPPFVDDCHRAAAWVAGFDNPADYAPVHET